MNGLLQAAAALSQGKYLVPITMNISGTQLRLDAVEYTISGKESNILTSVYRREVRHQTATLPENQEFCCWVNDGGQTRCVLPCSGHTPLFPNHCCVHTCHLAFSVLRRVRNIYNSGFSFVILRCVRSQKSGDLIYIAAEAWNHVENDYVLIIHLRLPTTI